MIGTAKLTQSVPTSASWPAEVACGRPNTVEIHRRRQMGNLGENWRPGPSALLAASTALIRPVGAQGDSGGTKLDGGKIFAIVMGVSVLVGAFLFFMYVCVTQSGRRGGRSAEDAGTQLGPTRNAPTVPASRSPLQDGLRPPGERASQGGGAAEQAGLPAL